MKVAVAGAAGFVGGHLIPLLCARYKEVRCLVRKTSDTSRICLQNVRLYYGGISDALLLNEMLAGVDRFICLAPFSTGYMREAVDACVKSGIKRSLFVGTTQMFTYQEPHIKKLILEAEDTIINSGLDYTIIRPTLIYGGIRDRNMLKFVRYLKRFPLIFIPGDGTSLQRPVYVGDVCKAVISAVESNNTIRKIYNIAGRDAITFNEMINIICSVIGLNRIKVHIPVSFILRFARALRAVGIGSYITDDKILRLNEDKDFDYADARQDFYYAPLSFNEGIKIALQEYGIKNWGILNKDER